MSRFIKDEKITSIEELIAVVQRREPVYFESSVIYAVQIELWSLLKIKLAIKAGKIHRAFKVAPGAQYVGDIQGLKCFINDDIPLGEIHISDGSGELIQKITGVGT